MYFWMKALKPYDIPTRCNDTEAVWNFSPTSAISAGVNAVLA